MTDSPVMRGAQPYFARGGALGVVLLHGFTASPHEVLWLGQALAAQGHTVYAPRLSGHGTRPEDLSRAHFEDWIATALDALAVIRAQCQTVVIGGLSMGGCVALNVAGRESVDGVVAMAALVRPFDISMASLRWGKYLRPYTDQTDRSPFSDYIKQQQAARGEPVLGRVRYGKWSTGGLEQLMYLIDDTQPRLAAITAPVLALYAQRDKVVPLDNLDVLKANLTQAARVETHIYQQSDHILTQDVESEDVFRRVGEFIAGVSAS